MKGEWCFFKNKYNQEQCEEIIRVAKQRPGKSAKIGVDGEVSNNEYRKSKIRFVYPGDPQLGFLFNDIWKMAMEGNNDFFDFHLSKLDYLQIAEYQGSEQGEYKVHQDVFYMNNDPKYHRKLSIIIQLSDPANYQGGEFQMYGIDQQPNPEDLKSQGTVILFPSFIQHAALPVVNGERFSIAAWVDGPKWR